MHTQQLKRGDEVVGDDNVDDNLVCVHTVDIMADKYADESDGLDGRMDDCLINCCRVVGNLHWVADFVYHFGYDSSV